MEFDHSPFMFTFGFDPKLSNRAMLCKLFSKDRSLNWPDGQENESLTNISYA